MKTLTNILTFFIALALFVAIIWAAFLGIQYVITRFTLLEPQVEAAAIIFSFMLLFSAFIIAGAIRNKTSRGDNTVHPEKADINKHFLDYYI